MISLKVMKCRNNIIRGLTVLLTMIILTGSGVAASAAERIFSDVPDNHWAERYIARMSLMGVVEGYEDGTYGLGRPVSRFEIIASIIRVMGLEDEAEGKSIPASFRYPASVPTWAQKYVAMGVIQGIISGDDLVSFRGGEPAKRYEVAEFVGKAMGLSAAAGEHATDVLPYRDDKDIPSRARGYISLLWTNGLMQGNEDGTFKPLANVTRAEMAALMAKLDEKMGKLPDKRVQGTVSQVTQSTITVKTADGYETLIVDEDCFIFLNGGKGNFTDIVPPLDGVLLVKDGFRAKLIDINDMNDVDDSQEVFSGQIFSGKVFGQVLSVSYYPELEIIISTSDEERQVISLRDDCIIERENEEVLLKDILPGDQVEIIVEEGKAEEIFAVPAEGTTKGKIKEVSIRDKAMIIVIDENGAEHAYEITSDTKIRKDGNSASLLELKAGDGVDVDWESNFARKVYAQARLFREQITGTATMVNTHLRMLVVSPQELNAGDTGNGEDTGDNDEQVVVFADDNTKIVTLDGTVSTRLNRVKTGNQLVIVGDREEDFITAQTIIILGAVE